MFLIKLETGYQNINITVSDDNLVEALKLLKTAKAYRRYDAKEEVELVTIVEVLPDISQQACRELKTEIFDMLKNKETNNADKS